MHSASIAKAARIPCGLLFWQPFRQPFDFVRRKWLILLVISGKSRFFGKMVSAPAIPHCRGFFAYFSTKSTRFHPKTQKNEYFKRKERQKIDNHSDNRHICSKSAKHSSKMKPYLVFFASDYMTMGGIGDLAGTSNTLEDALESVNKLVEKRSQEADLDEDDIKDFWNNHWAHIYCCSTGKVVHEKGNCVILKELL